MSETDLFDLPDPSRRDPRIRPVHMPKEASSQVRRISSTEEMVSIFKEEVAKDYPSAAQIEEFKAAGHRYSVEDGRFQVEGIVTRVTPGGFRRMVRMLLDKTNEGSHHHTLNRTQGNGVWVPVGCAIRQATHPMNDRKVPLPKDRFGGEMEAIDVSGTVSAAMLPVPVEVLEYRIQWMDAAGAEDIKYDARGNVVVDQSVKVQTGGDPALAAAIEKLADGQARLAESLSPTPTPAPKPSTKG